MLSLIALLKPLQKDRLWKLRLLHRAETKGSTNGSYSNNLFFRAGAAPDVMFIKCDPPNPQLNHECTLHLYIKDFCPEDVSVTWTQDGETIYSGIFNTPPNLSVNGLYAMHTFLKFTPNMDNWNSKFRCKVVHSAQTEPEERLFILSDLSWASL